MADFPDRISPLEAVAEPGAYGAQTENPPVEISERLPVSLMQVAAWPDTIADVKTELSKFAKAELMPGQAVTRGEEAIIMPSGPGRWLVDSEDAQLENHLVKMLPNKLAAVTGLTHSRVVVRVQGEKTTWLLASGVALDFHTSAFPVGDVRMSHHHEIGLTLHRLGEDDFELYLFTSFARPFWEWICKSAEEVGFRVV